VTEERGAPIGTEHLTALGRPVREPMRHVECFAAPPGVTRVRFTTDEVASLCPVTRQPDLSSVAIDYEPGQWCVESKSLKLYLWSFRDREVFAEALAVEIADEIMATAAPREVTVTLTQRPRGGIAIEATAVRSATVPEDTPDR
jgi:7-cyano-7-deazaguanine reductase